MVTEKIRVREISAKITPALARPMAIRIGNVFLLSDLIMALYKKYYILSSIMNCSELQKFY
jgi:hypothetical protein